MTVVQVITAIGFIPLFASRIFLPAFLLGLFMSYPSLFPGIDAIPPVPDETVFTRTWVLITLGVLSILEIIADKSPEIRSLMSDALIYLKPASYMLVGLGLVDKSSAQILNEVQWAGFNPMWVLFILGMLAVYWLAMLRGKFINFLEDIDEDDNMFIGHFASWMEDSLVVFGFFLLISSGFLMVAVYVIFIAFFIHMRKRFEKKLESQKTECAHCSEKNLPFAVKCCKCNKLQANIQAIGIFGQRKKELVYSIEKHQINLISQRRCPDCGNKLKNRNVSQTCDHCSTQLFESPTFQDFTKSIDKKFYKITGASFLLGFIPIIGFVISAVLANIYLFSPYRRYIPKKSSFITKILIRCLTFIFFLFGVAFGFVAAPAYCIMRYYIWRGKLKQRATRPSNVLV